MKQIEQINNDNNGSRKESLRELATTNGCRAERERSPDKNRYHSRKNGYGHLRSSYYTQRDRERSNSYKEHDKTYRRRYQRGSKERGRSYHSGKNDSNSDLEYSHFQRTKNCSRSPKRTYSRNHSSTREGIYGSHQTNRVDVSPKNKRKSSNKDKKNGRGRNRDSYKNGESCRGSSRSSQRSTDREDRIRHHRKNGKSGDLAKKDPSVDIQSVTSNNHITNSKKRKSDQMDGALETQIIDKPQPQFRYSEEPCSSSSTKINLDHTRTKEDDIRSIKAMRQSTLKYIVNQYNQTRALLRELNDLEVCDRSSAYLRLQILELEERIEMLLEDKDYKAILKKNSINLEQQYSYLDNNWYLGDKEVRDLLKAYHVDLLKD